MKRIITNNTIAFCASILLFSLFYTKAGAQNITYSFANAKITEDGGTYYYEVDIMISTDTDFKFGAANIFINYNTAAFGTNIGASNGIPVNNTIDLPHPTGFVQGGNAEYLMDDFQFTDSRNGVDIYSYSLSTFNALENRVTLNFSQQDNSEFLPTISSSNSPRKLCLLRIPYINNGETEDPMITFDSASSDNTTFTAQTNPNTPTADGVQLTNDTYDSSNSAPANMWTGATDSNWSTASNWIANLIPGTTDNAIIPSGLTNYPTATSAVTVNNLTIESDASFIAQNSFTGTVTYERSLSSSNWHLVSSPVMGQDEDDFVAASGLQVGSSNNIGLGTYNTENDSWDYYQSGTSTSNVLTSGVGYAVNLAAANGEIAFTGSLLTTDLSPINLATTGNGYNLVGNPYTSYLNSGDLLSTNTSSLLNETLWVWDQSANGGAGAYTTYVTIQNFKIAPGQGFFVQSNGASGTLSINESFRSHQTTVSFKRSQSSGTTDIGQINLKLIDDNSSESQTKIFYIEGATTGFDNGYDGTVFGGISSNNLSVYTQLVSNNEGNNYAIQSLPPENYEDMVVPVGVNAKSGDDLTFSAEALNLPNDLNVYLEDADTNTFTKLNDGGTYQVTLSSDLNSTGRFYLHTTQKVLSNGGNILLADVSMYMSSPNNLRIQGLEPGQKTTVNIHNVLGQSVLTNSFDGERINNIALPNLRSGIYLVNLSTDRGKTSKKIIID